MTIAIIMIILKIFKGNDIIQRYNVFVFSACAILSLSLLRITGDHINEGVVTGDTLTAIEGTIIYIYIIIALITSFHGYVPPDINEKKDH